MIVLLKRQQGGESVSPSVSERLREKCQECEGEGGATGEESGMWYRCPFCAGTGWRPIDREALATEIEHLGLIEEKKKATRFDKQQRAALHFAIRNLRETPTTDDPQGDYDQIGIDTAAEILESLVESEESASK